MMVCQTNARTVAAADFGSRLSDRINVPSSLLEGVQPSLVRMSHIVGHSFSQWHRSGEQCVRENRENRGCLQHRRGGVLATLSTDLAALACRPDGDEIMPDFAVGIENSLGKVGVQDRAPEIHKRKWIVG